MITESIERHSPVDLPPDSCLVASPIDNLQALRDKEAAFASEAGAQVLVLEPIGPMSRLRPILLDQSKQVIGQDVACEIQLLVAGVHSRHAVILRGQRQVVIKASDPRTWLNGLPIRESTLADGDVLRIGPVEFRVRAATTDELLSDLPATERIPHNDDQSDSTGRLVLRRSQLSSILVQLKELSAELARDFERVDAEYLELETARKDLATVWAELRAGREQFQSKRGTVGAAEGTAAVVAGLSATLPDSGPEQRDTAANQWKSAADRLNQCFRKTVRRATTTVPAPKPWPTTSSTSVPDAAPVQEQKVACAQTEVADYMVHLLGRVRSRTGGGVLAKDQFAVNAARDCVSSENATSKPADPALSAESPDSVSIEIPRRPHNVEEIRASVVTLREIANQSARTAVAKHSTHKFRKSMALTLPLAIISFPLAGVLFLNGGNESGFYLQGFGTVLLGLIALIEFANSFRKAKDVDLERTQAVCATGMDAPQPAGAIDDNVPVTAHVNQNA